MRIFLITGVVPSRKDGQPGVTAAHVVSAALALSLKKRGHDVVVQPLLHQSRTPGDLSSEENGEVSALKSEGCEVLDPIYLSEHVHPNSERLRSLKLLIRGLSVTIAHFYPGFAARHVMAERIASTSADVVVPIWTPEGVAATSGIETPRVIYHGDIDTDPTRCRYFLDAELFGNTLKKWDPRWWDRRLRLFLHERAHRATLLSAKALAHVTDSNRVHYEKLGHRLSRYVGNCWIDSAKPCDPPKVTADQPVRIIGHVGYLNRTGSTYGLQFLLQDVLPHLPEAFGSQPFEVHIIGGGETFPALRTLLSHPNIVKHGFVEDLDAELAASHVFCIFNNAGRYKAAYTRHLVAWSNGLCLLAHADSSLAIPEIVDGNNAALAQDGKEAARKIVALCKDTELNERLRKEGRRTFEQRFTPDSVASELEKVIEEALSK